MEYTKEKPIKPADVINATEAGFIEEICKRWNGYAESEARDTIMVETLAEIKAKIEGNSEQPQSIREIVEGCIEELAAIAQGKE